MNIKTKLTLSTGLLFVLILLLSIIGTKYINDLQHDTENILETNYNSLEYCTNILAALDLNNATAIDSFEHNLRWQEANISENGEYEATQQLRRGYTQWLKNTNDSSIQNQIRQTIFGIMQMNMLAIQRKSNIAKNTADKGVTWIATAGTLCFLIAFTLLINLPAHIGNPIKTLTESIQQIAAKNYAERVHFESHSEFGQLAKSFNSMAQKLEEYNNSNLATVMMEKKRIDTLINNMHDPVIGLSENLQILFANEAAMHVTGLTEKDWQNKSADELAKNNDLINTLLNSVSKNNTEWPPKQPPLKIISNSQEQYFEKEIQPIHIIPTGEKISRLVGYVIFLRNVTSYKELDVAKTNFIATVSHEFKTPISAIKMSVQLLENEEIGQLNKEQQQLLTGIKEDAGRLLKITSELLNMAQVESGHIQLDLQPVHPMHLLSNALQAIQTQAEQKQLRIKTQAPDPLATVLADAEKTTWVLINILTNAIRFSYEQNSINIILQEHADSISIAIQDFGRGIETHYLDKIFHRYFRVPGTHKDGTGLGLSISKDLMEAQSGHIQVSSEFGAGSTFTITLPKSA